MKLLALADIHQLSNKWKLLVKIVEDQKPDIVAIAGDLLPKDNGIPQQIGFAKHLVKYAEKIKAAGSELVLILGNDDHQDFIGQMESGDDQGLWHYVSDLVKEVKGYEFCGCSWVPDYPFGYKYWIARDDGNSPAICSFQFGPPVILNAENKFEEIEDFKAYMAEKMSIEESLADMASKVRDMSKSIWLIHAPPAKLGLDVCASGDKVGSNSVLKFIEDKQPLLSIHGHIHESPEYSGVWHKQVGDTYCIQAGQSGRELVYVIVDLEDKVNSLTHSKYGDSDE